MAVGQRACGRPRRGPVAAGLPHWSRGDGRLPNGRTFSSFGVRLSPHEPNSAAENASQAKSFAVRSFEQCPPSGCAQGCANPSTPGTAHMRLVSAHARWPGQRVATPRPICSLGARFAFVCLGAHARPASWQRLTFETRFWNFPDKSGASAYVRALRALRAQCTAGAYHPNNRVPLRKTPLERGQKLRTRR